MSEPIVDVVIPVHTIERPIARAVASVLVGTACSIRVNVVCHNVSKAAIRVALGAWADDSRVRLLHLEDGLKSPAGPINVGLDAASAQFTSLLDSDDTYERGAVDAWLRVQARDDSDIVIPMFKYANGRSSRTPPTRPFRSRRLDGVRDRLAYRTRQHGLVSQAHFSNLRMTPGLSSGEDVIQGACIWYSNARISFARNTPAYCIHEDGGERASVSVKPVSESLAFLDTVLGPSFLDTLTNAQRESFAVKLLRTHIMDVLKIALISGSDTELGIVAESVRRINALVPSARSIVSQRDARIFDHLTGENPDLSRIYSEITVRADYPRVDNVLTARLTSLFHSQAPLRFLVATFFAP